jgi:hypothetical protein
MRGITWSSVCSTVALMLRLRRSTWQQCAMQTKDSVALNLRGDGYKQGATRRLTDNRATWSW